MTVRDWWWEICSCKLGLSDARGTRGGEIVRSLLEWYTPLPAGCSLPFGDLRHLPTRVVWCARLWLALPVSVDRKSVVTNWFAGIAGAIGMGLGLTMLPNAGSRGRFCADMSVGGAVSAGPEAEEAGRASAGSTSMLNPKIGLSLVIYAFALRAASSRRGAMCMVVSCSRLAAMRKLLCSHDLGTGSPSTLAPPAIVMHAPCATCDCWQLSREEPAVRRLLRPPASNSGGRRRYHYPLLQCLSTRLGRARPTALRAEPFALRHDHDGRRAASLMVRLRTRCPEGVGPVAKQQRVCVGANLVESALRAHLDVLAGVVVLRQVAPGHKHALADCPPARRPRKLRVGRTVEHLRVAAARERVAEDGAADVEVLAHV
eukprot:scaffold11428_cov105-Isochrysis_galbana.AAC.11